MPSITSQYFYFTNDGLIWFSTARGLTSFDGSEVIYYSNLQESNQFNLNGIGAIAEDADNNLYIGAGTKLCIYKRQQRKFVPLGYTFKDGKKTEGFFTNAIFIDQSGLVFIGAGYLGMFIYNPVEKKMHHLNLDASKPDHWSDRWLNSIGSIAAHARDSSKLWIGTANGIYLFDKKTSQFSRNFEIINPGIYKYTVNIGHYDVQKMDVADDSTIWFNSYTSGFCRYNSRTGKAKIFTHNAIRGGNDYLGYIIRTFAKSNTDKYCLAINDPHPGMFDPQKETLELIPIMPSPGRIEITRYVANDKKGNLWLLSNGLLFAEVPEYYRLQTIGIRKIPTPTRYNNIYDIYFDTASKTYLFAGRTLDGVYVLDNNFTHETTIPVPLVSNYFLRDVAITDHITLDGSRRFWTTGLQTCILQPGGRKFDTLSSVFPSLSWLQKIEFSDILTTRDGNICLRKSGNGTVYIIDHKTLQADTVKIPFFKPSANYDINIYFIDYDSSRNWLYTSNRNSIIRYDINKKEITALGEDLIFGPVKKEMAFLKFKLDDKHRIWIMIQAYGIRIIDPVTLACIDSIPFGEKGLLKNDCTDIKYGGKNRMMLKSGDGIIVYDYAEKRSVFFNYSNGYSYQLPKSYLYCNNHLFIGQMGLVEYYDLENFNKFNFKLRPFLNTLTAGSVNVFTRSSNDSASSVRLRWWQNNLSFTFSATEFFFAERIEYAYQLSGFDKEWQYTNSINRKINYTRLKPGKYIFKLMAQVEGGNWKEKPVEYTLIIVPAWWQTDLFKVFCILLTLGAGFYFYRKRILDIKKKEQQKTQHEKELLELEAKALRAQMNPHFIFNSMNSIKSLINKNENDAAASYLTTFSKLIRTLFQNSDKREVSLYEELETCKLYAQLEKMRFGDKVEFVFDIDPSLDLKDIKVPALIIQPFIENAIWHGLVPKETGGKVTVVVQRTNDAVECIIDDNGIGRELSKQYKAQYEATHESKGIGLTQSRLEMDKLLNEREDSIQIIDKKNENGVVAGTTIILTFKEK